MQNVNKYLFKNAMVYGAILGGIMVFLDFMVYATDLGFFKFLESLEFFYTVAILSIGTLHLRNEYLNGAITYGKSVGSGIMISIFGGFIFASYSYIMMHYIDPKLLEESYQIAEELFLKFGLTENEVEQLMEKMNHASPLYSVIMGSFGFGFLGLLISLITSIFIKKTADPFNHSSNIHQE